MTYAVATPPNVAGTSRSRSVVSACLDTASVPSPASGTSIWAMFCPGCVVTVTGPPNSRLSPAAFFRPAMALPTCGDPMSAALTTTCAGAGPPGNAVEIRW